MHVPFQTKLHNYQSKLEKPSPPNAKSWNGLKRSIAGNLKKNYFRGYADHAYALLGYHQSQGRLRS